jgi:hypothetical protein
MQVTSFPLKAGLVAIDQRWLVKRDRPGLAIFLSAAAGAKREDADRAMANAAPSLYCAVTDAPCCCCCAVGGTPNGMNSSLRWQGDDEEKGRNK